MKKWISAKSQYSNKKKKFNNYNERVESITTTDSRRLEILFWVFIKFHSYDGQIQYLPSYHDLLKSFHLVPTKLIDAVDI